MRPVLVGPSARDGFAPISEEMLIACLETIAEDTRPFSKDPKREQAARLAYASHFIARCPDVSDVTLEHIATTLGITRQGAQQVELVALHKVRRVLDPQFESLTIPRLGAARSLRGRKLHPETVRERKNAAHRRWLEEKRAREALAKLTEEQAEAARDARLAARRAEYRREAAKIGEARRAHLASKVAP